MDKVYVVEVWEKINYLLEEKQLSKKEFREQFQKEAGTLRTSGSPAPPNEE